ncbi:MAG: peptidylprolyl isomerase [Chloroflexota bacterium]
MKCTYLLAALLVLLTCLSVSAADDPVLAQVGDWKITKSDFERLMSYYPEAKKYLEGQPQNQETFLKRIVQTYVISQVARKDGFDKKPEIKEQLDLNIDNYLATQFLKTEIVDKIVVTEEEMSSYYKAHQEEFTAPEQVKASHILIRVDATTSEDTRNKAKEKASEILARIKKGEDFGTLASEFSEDPGSKAKGGDLGFFSRGMMVKPFEDAAFSLKPGEVSDMVETQFGYHIIKVSERKDAEVQPYESVKEAVKLKVTDELRKTRLIEYIDKAMKDSGVQLHPELLQENK